MSKKIDLSHVAAEVSKMMIKYNDNQEVKDDFQKIFDMIVERIDIANEIESILKEIVKRIK